jgi:Regulator of ribonuclease activity B
MRKNVKDRTWLLGIDCNIKALCKSLGYLFLAGAIRNALYGAGMKLHIPLILMLFIFGGCELQTQTEHWPNNADGDVFRRLVESDFDFGKEYVIDINLDFDHWPLTDDEFAYIKSQFPDVQVIHPEPGEDIGNGIDVGFLQFQVKSKLSYKYITELKDKVERKISKYGGWCDSWGVMQE